MSHSEIAGSKLAHSSPTLIAACHVLHRLYMPRHSPDALTSRLRAHTTNDSPEDQKPLAIWSLYSARYFSADKEPVQAICKRPPDRARVATASIKKTHSQCQRSALGAPYMPDGSGKPLLFIARDTKWTGRLGGAYRDRTDDLMLAKQPLSQLS